jgi:hypothetical protein
MSGRKGKWLSKRKSFVSNRKIGKRMIGNAVRTTPEQNVGEKTMNDVISNVMRLKTATLIVNPTAFLDVLRGKRTVKAHNIPHDAVVQGCYTNPHGELCIVFSSNSLEEGDYVFSQMN